jgi:hypothetical protein
MWLLLVKERISSISERQDYFKCIQGAASAMRLKYKSASALLTTCISGTLPKAFRHSRLGFVDAFVMYTQLGA